MEYREIKKNEIERKLFKDFIRHQVVTKCWRRDENGAYVIKDDPFIDEWTEEEYGILVDCLKNTVATSGVVYGAFEEGKLKGFASVEGGFQGSENQYLDLSSLHVSEDMRGHGIGRVLFDMAKKWAKDHGGKKLYISGHSALETQAFYKAMGCTEAQEYNMKHVEEEPWDCQLECEL